MKKLLVFILLIAIVSVFAFSRKNSGVKTPVDINNVAYDTKVFIAGKALSAQIAKTEKEREQGLSDRVKMCSDCGMLFIFDQPSIYYFWMPRMYYDIDILWLAGDRVVDITYDAKAPSVENFDNPKERYFSKVLIDKVLEVNAGWVKENGIKLGDEVKF